MATDDRKPVPGLHYNRAELIELVRVNLRRARSFPPGERRDKHRQVAKALRVLFRSRNWVVERVSAAPVGLFGSAGLTGASMSGYQAHYVGADGHFTGFRDLNVDSDAAAIESAKKMLDGKDIEIWCGVRKVIRIPHRPE